MSTHKHELPDTRIMDTHQKQRMDTHTTHTPPACTGTATSESCTRGEAAARPGPCRSVAWRDTFLTENGDAKGQQNKKTKNKRFAVSSLPFVDYYIASTYTVI